MRLSRLAVTSGTAGTITVVCKVTKKRAIWNDAAREGWVADLDGEPFNAYYSPEGETILRERSEVSLYDALKAAGIETASHESDLYFPASPEALAILARYPLQKGNAAYFTNEAPPNVGERWVDVPFAFKPFWDKVVRRAE